MIQGIIIGHGDIGAGLISALKSISSRDDDIEFITNTGRSTSDIAGEVRAFSERVNCSDGLVIFVDLFGGSCWQGAKLANLPGSHVVTGVNLPMLLSFFNKRVTHAFEDLVIVLDRDGKRGITTS